MKYAIAITMGLTLLNLTLLIAVAVSVADFMSDTSLFRVTDADNDRVRARMARDYTDNAVSSLAEELEVRIAINAGR